MKNLFLACVLGAMTASAGLLVACSDDATATPAKDAGADVTTSEASSDAPTGAKGSVVATVTYGGTTASAKLTVAAIGDKGFAGSTEKVVVFPGTIKLNPITDLEPGSYLIGASLDVGGNNPQEPGPEDLLGGEQVTVVAGKAVEVSITLDVQPPADGGKDAPADASDGG